MYRKVQKLFRKDPSRLLDNIMEDSLGKVHQILERAENYWKELLGRESPRGAPEVEKTQDRLGELMAPISEEEVVELL